MKKIKKDRKLMQRESDKVSWSFRQLKETIENREKNKKAQKELKKLMMPRGKTRTNI